MASRLLHLRYEQSDLKLLGAMMVRETGREKKSFLIDCYVMLDPWHTEGTVHDDQENKTMNHSFIES